MKAKVLPYLIFFLAGLGFAYYASGPKEESKRPSEEWTKIPKDSVESISYEYEGVLANIQRAEGFQAYWVDYTRVKEGPGGAKEEAGRFLAGDRMKEVQDLLASVQVEKVIGSVKDIKVEEFGLDKPSGKFEVKYGSDKIFKLAIGKRSFQSQGVFVLDESKQTVLMVNRKLFSAFERPKTRLELDHPFLFSPDEVTSVIVSSGSSQEEFVRQNKGAARVWFARNKTDVPHESFRNWLEKFMRLKVEAYPEEGQAAAIEQLPRKFSLQLGGDKGELDVLALFEDSSTNPARYWVKSKSLPVPVGVDAAAASVLVGDVAGLTK